MRRVVMIVIVGIVAFAGYRYYTNSYGPVRQYKAFSDAILHRQYDVAAAMAEGLSAADLAQHGSQERIGAGPAMFQTIFAPRYAIDSQQTNADGSITINATQTVLFNPPGVESATRPAMYAVLKQVVTLRNGKVVAFENTFDHMDTTTTR